MKNILLLLLLVTAPSAITRAENASNSATSSVWITGPDAAFQRATELRRPLLINFTGSDWCIWCHRVRDEIFVQKHFVDYAATHLVLLEVDSPRQTKLPADLEKQHAALKEKYTVTGYPTLLLIDANGRELGRLGYMQGGAKTFVRELKRLTGPVMSAAPAPSEAARAPAAR